MEIQKIYNLAHLIAVRVPKFMCQMGKVGFEPTMNNLFTGLGTVPHYALTHFSSPT